MPDNDHISPDAQRSLDAMEFLIGLAEADEGAKARADFGKDTLYWFEILEQAYGPTLSPAEKLKVLSAVQEELGYPAKERTFKIGKWQWYGLGLLAVLTAKIIVLNWIFS